MLEVLRVSTAFVSDSLQFAYSCGPFHLNGDIPDDDVWARTSSLNLNLEVRESSPEPTGQFCMISDFLCIRLERLIIFERINERTEPVDGSWENASRFDGRK